MTKNKTTKKEPKTSDIILDDPNLEKEDSSVEETNATETSDIILDDPNLEKEDSSVEETNATEINELVETETTGNKIPEPVQEEKNEVPTIPNENPPKETKETQTKISFTPVWKYQKGDKVFTKKYPNQSFRIVKQFGWTTNLENVYYIKSNRTHDEAYILEHELSYTLVF